jgi:hypothetical protein
MVYPPIVHDRIGNTQPILSELPGRNGQNRPLEQIFDGLEQINEKFPDGPEK